MSDRLNQGWRKTTTSKTPCICADCKRVFDGEQPAHDIWQNKNDEVLCLSCYRNMISDSKGIN